MPVGQHMPENTIFEQIKETEFGSIIVVIATDAPLLPSQLSRVAKRAGLGLARTGSIAANGSGDIFLALSTANDPVDVTRERTHLTLEALEAHYLDSVYRAARDATDEAIINAMLAAETSVSFRPRGVTGYAIDHERLLAVMAAHRAV